MTDSPTVLAVPAVPIGHEETRRSKLRIQTELGIPVLAVALTLHLLKSRAAMPLTQHYHTRDPIENLRIHVALRKIASAPEEDDGLSSSNTVGVVWDYCFKWQEKKLTNAQYALQLARITKNRKRDRRKSKSKTNSGDDDTQADPNGDTETNSPPSLSSESAVLCSYIDADNYVPAEELARHVTASHHASNQPTHLVGARQRRLPHDHLALVTPQRSNTERAWVRHHREESYRAMHIVASFEGCSEKVLCAIRFDAESGLLSVTPGFSTPVDLENDPEALFKGPKLSTYHVSIGGAQYEYTLDNVNDLLPLVSTSDQQLLRELQIRDERQDAARVALLTGGDGGTGRHDQQQLYYEAMKLNGVLIRRLVLVEVVSALDLVSGTSDDAPVYVELTLHFPHGGKHQQSHWRRRVMGKAEANTSNAAATRSRLSISKRSANGSTFTVFNFHTKLDLELCKQNSKALSGEPLARDGSEKLGPDGGSDGEDLLVAAISPVLSLSVFSQDSWGRKRTEGFGELAIPLTAGYHDRLVPIARPILSIREQMEELFLGIDESEGVYLQDSQLSSESTTRHNVNSRLGVQVQSSGASIRIRVNIVDQSSPPPPVESQVSSHKSHKRGGVPVLPHPLPGLRVVKRSVNEILQSVRLEKRILQAGSGGDPSNLHSPLSASAVVSSVLARLNPVKSPSGASI